MEFFKKNLLFFFIICLMFSLDRISKIYVINFFLDQNIQSYYFNDFLNFVLIWNTGIAFGIFESENILYHSISILIFIVICILIIWLFKSAQKFEKVSISIIIGGAFGNLFDRIVYNAVPDFIDIHYHDFHWFVFNVSDIVITFGVILLLLKDLFSKKNV